MAALVGKQRYLPTFSLASDSLRDSSNSTAPRTDAQNTPNSVVYAPRALTRNIQYYDQPTIRVIARESARENYSFASLVLGVVNSVPFQSRMAPAAPQ